MRRAARMLWPRALDWARDGRDWPNREASRFVRASGIEWHVQVAGAGPALLALHGAGGANHSWGPLLPLLAERFTVIAPDLPGHGFTSRPPDPGLSLPGAARRIGELLAALDAAPVLGIGHSAGAAVLARMALDRRMAPAGLVAVNGALTPFKGLPGVLLPAMARALRWNPLAARVIATAALDPNAVPAMIRGMGSRIGRQGVGLYARLMRSPDHVAGTIGMMAAWDLDGLLADLPRLEIPVLLLAASRDRAVPPAQAAEIASRLPNAEVTRLEGLGHLAHEEAPERVAGAVLSFADRLGIATA